MLDELPLIDALAPLREASENHALHASILGVAVDPGPETLRAHARHRDARLELGARVERALAGGSALALEGVEAHDAVVCEAASLAASLRLAGEHVDVANALSDWAFDAYAARDFELFEDADPVHAARELVHLITLGLDPDTNRTRIQNAHRSRTAITTHELTHWPNLVGAAVVQYADALAGEPERDDETQHYYRCVVLDLDYLLERVDDPSLPRYEALTALTWLATAYARRGEDEQRERALALLRERGHTRLLTAPRAGLLARLYTDEPSWLARALMPMRAGALEAEEELRIHHHTWGLAPGESEFFFSAIGSHDVARHIIAGAHTIYDEHHERVFDALRRLDGEDS